MHTIPTFLPLGRKLLCLAVASCCATSALADDNQPVDGSLGRWLFGDDFGAADMLRVGGWIEAGAVLKQADGAPRGLGNSPIVLARDRGLQLNQAYLYVEKDIRTNVITRATPIPAPVFENYSWGYHVDLLYGRDGQPLQTFGWDDRWGINNPGNSNPAKAASNRQNFLINPQAYLQAYLPWGLGTAVMAGNFMSPIGNEIGFHPQPGPNIFYTHTYAFTAAPIKHTGVLAASNLMKSDNYGLLAAEFGVVNGWSNFKDNNNKAAYIGALRWRSPGMDTWVDYEFMTGDAQSTMDRLLSDARDANVPVTRVMSPRGQRKTQHFLTIATDWDEQWHAQLGFNHGKQNGDGASDTIDIISGPGFKGATWQGVEARVKYKVDDQLSVAARVEKFQDRDGFALFPNSVGIRSDYNAITLGAQYWIDKRMLLRPELRHDWQTNNKGVKAFNNGNAARQTALNVDLIVYF